MKLYNLPALHRPVPLSIHYFLLLIALICVSGTGVAQTLNAKDTAFVNELLTKSKSLFGEDPEKAIAVARQAQAAAISASFKKGEATALKNIGVGYYFQQKYVEALDYWNQSLKIFQSLNDEVGISNLLNNMGAIYKDQGDDARALDYCLQALKLAEKTSDTTRLISSLATVAGIYHNKKDPKAIDYLLKALHLCETPGHDDALALLLGNIGEVYYDRNEYDKALPFYQRAISMDNTSATAAFAYNGVGKIYERKRRYDLALENHNKALTISEKLNEKIHRFGALKGIANVYYAEQQYPLALESYNKARLLGEEISANVELKDLYQEMSLAYEKVSDYKNALTYKAKYADIKDTLYNVETSKKLGRLQFDFDLSKKEGQIALLTKENSLRDEELRRQRLTRIGLITGLGLLVILALVLLRSYRIKVRTAKVLDGQKAEIEGLLLNILPEEVARELEETGQATPRNYDSASVMFSDFQGFTTITHKMAPEVLVEQLNTCFKAFDQIIEKYELEKIKTIGDAYMCAGGIPTPDNQHAYKMVKASLAIQAYVTEYNQQREERGEEPWELRIGIHAGPVVAGVVGMKKYAYDIWGSTVNIASRMESNSAPGQVNISSAVYELIKDRFICSHRGKIYAKNVGDVDMYFVQHEIDTSFPVKQSIETEASPVPASEP